MTTLLDALNTTARLGVAAGLLLIGYEMHGANAPTRPATIPQAAGYVQTSNAADLTKKPPATISTIDADLREINYTLSGITVAIGQATMTSSPRR